MSAAPEFDPAEIRRLRAQHPQMRERDFARIHKLSEAQLVAAFVGESVTRLNADVATLLHGLPALGEVMALTRNESAVHEKIGPYENVTTGAKNAIVLGKEIDLRIFPNKWTSGFAVEKAGEDGAVRRSLQFFDAAGDAVHKVHLRPASDLGAYRGLVDRLRAEDQSQSVTIEPVADVDAVAEGTAQAGPEELRERWSQLTDTHQFFGMLKSLNLTRHQAIHLIDRDYAWPLELGATRALLDGAAASGLPIMVFIGNRGCTQIHSGPVHKVETMGPWLNIFDETFHLHLRLDHITEVWAVRKPTAKGHVTSIETFGAHHNMIIQFFGKRQEGFDERQEWRRLAEGLQRQDQSNAA